MRQNVLVVMLAATVGILAGGLRHIEADPPLREMVSETPDSGQPSYVIAGRNASLQYWKTPDGAVSQTLYRSADGTLFVRTFYDESTGLPRRISDEISGNWLLIQENGADSVDFWFYEIDGSYQSGMAVFEDAGQYYFGEIAGLPIHAGKEITGDLLPTTTSWTGSFKLDVDTGDLKTSRPVAADIAALLGDLALGNALHSELSLGGMLLLGLGLVDGTSGDAVAPADMTAFEALAGAKVVVFTYTDVDYMLSVEFLSADRFVWTDQNDSYPGNFSYVNTGPDTGTITLTFDPNNDPDEYEQVFEVTFTSGTMGTYASIYREKGEELGVASGHFKIADDRLATVGAAAFVTSLFVPDVAAGDQYKCTHLANADSRDVCRLAADFLAYEGEHGPTGLVRDGVDWVRDKPGRLRDRIDRGQEALENVAGGMWPDDAIGEREDTEPLALEIPPPIGSRVSGEASGPDGTVAQVAGDITLDGEFAVTGDDDNDLPVVINGTIGDGDTSDSGEVASTINRTGTSSLRATTGNVVVAGDIPAYSAAFEWGSDSGSVHSVRSAIILHGDAPVVVRKIQFLRGPNDGQSVTLDLSEYFSDPNGESMRFTAVASNFQEHLDVRVSGSMVSIRQILPDFSLTTRIQVTATDPGGLMAETSFPVKTSSFKAAILWSDTNNSPGWSYCEEWVITDIEAYQEVQGDRYHKSQFHTFYLPRLDNPGDHFETGLNCSERLVALGGCRSQYDWGTHTFYSHVHCPSSSAPTECRQNFPAIVEERRRNCVGVGAPFEWVTQRPLPTTNQLQRVRSWIIKYFEVPGSRGSRPRGVSIGVRG